MSEAERKARETYQGLKAAQQGFAVLTAIFLVIALVVWVFVSGKAAMIPAAGFVYLLMSYPKMAPELRALFE